MSGSPRIPPGSGVGPTIHTAPDHSNTQRDGTYPLSDVDRKLVEIENNETEWEQRITLQGLPVIPVSMPADYSLVRPPENKNAEQPRKRKATAIRILSRYWDNRAELHQFGSEAQWLHKRLSSGQHKTRLVIPQNIKPSGVHRSLNSPVMWEGIIETWLNMSAQERAQALEHKLRHVVLPEDDPRTGLRGQSGVLAARDIAPYTVLGPYVGRYCHGRDLAEEQGVHGANVGRYAVDCSLDTVRLDLCGYGYGNITVCINANTTYRPGEPLRTANAFFMLAIYRGWPYVYVVSYQPIAKGQEVLVDYGRYYWLGY